MSPLSIGRLSVFDIRRNVEMFWVTNFPYDNLTCGDITRIDALRLYTSTGTGIVPVHFKVVMPFELRAVDFIDLDYHLYAHRKVSNRVYECEVGMVIQVSELPRIQLTIREGIPAGK